MEIFHDIVLYRDIIPPVPKEIVDLDIPQFTQKEIYRVMFLLMGHNLTLDEAWEWLEGWLPLEEYLDETQNDHSIFMDNAEDLRVQLTNELIELYGYHYFLFRDMIPFLSNWVTDRCFVDVEILTLGLDSMIVRFHYG